MDSIRIPAKDEAISQGLAFLSQSLRQHRVGAKEANRAMLMAEEAMVKSGPGESQSRGGATALHEAERGGQEGGGWH